MLNVNQSINFYFHDAKERMRVAAKDQLVIESAVPYCSKLTSRKLPNGTKKKKRKSYMNALNLHKISRFFHQTMATNHFLQIVQYTEKNSKI